MIKILFLSANPKGSEPLRLAEEIRDIKESIKLSNNYEKIKISQGEALTTKDLRRLLLDEQPNIVHYSGHSSNEGIHLEDEYGNISIVGGQALKELFSLFDFIDCVILNSCYSENQANHIVKEVPYVIGMKNPIKDKDAINFSIGFYDALSRGRNIEDSFLFGKNAIELNKASSTNRSLDIVASDKQSSTSILLLRSEIKKPSTSLNKKSSLNYLLPYFISVGLIILAIIAYIINSEPKYNELKGFVFENGEDYFLKDVHITSSEYSNINIWTDNFGGFKINVPNDNNLKKSNTITLIFEKNGYTRLVLPFRYSKDKFFEIGMDKE